MVSGQMAEWWKQLYGESEGKERYKAHSVTDPLLKNPQQAEWTEKFKHD